MHTQMGRIKLPAYQLSGIKPTKSTLLEDQVKKLCGWLVSDDLPGKRERERERKRDISSRLIILSLAPYRIVK